ncbi:hypothetical protein NCCP2716_25180 [Sporosarcina sp. NCCP-2716]|uniref:transglutaminase domain-containing protein n=1 Tax=Sporosarcina sp. NCCP-2716 TaxID=2943679 RepID=UPI002041DE28|nr:transglutaminase domain-containing protein [Sporosarcina sp. NCCP-2716]GKV70020.1 hypothetical protein NCCP2716_25180 [Sporosarcina sp. NCCP-2716]
MKDTPIDKRLLVFLYILAFFLTVEWLRPIADLTGTGHISHFYGFVALSMIIGLVRLPGWIGVPVKLLFIVFSIQAVFYSKAFMAAASLRSMGADFTGSLSLIWSGDWMELSNLFRTVLFFILLWMISYLLRFWMEYRKSIFLFFGMTVIFLAVIDTFTDYDASYAVLRVMVIGLFLLGVLFPLRLTGKLKTKLPAGELLKLILPLSLVLLTVGMLAVLMPVKEPAWPDPIPLIRSAAGFGESGDGTGDGVSKVGYDADDTQLGGPFRQDDTLVFEVYAESRQYWKMETKNTYTSKGWVQLSNDEFPEYNGQFAMIMGGQVTEPPRQRADIELHETLPLLPYPYGFEELQLSEMNPYRQEPDSGQLTVEMDMQAPFTYRAEYIEPVYSLKALRETKMEDLQKFGGELDEYLALPGDLPKRIADLALDLTKDQPSVYQKAQAIERYFGRSGFVYSRENVAVPKEDDDYVDQFLFETKRGYCDNFSSSMVVMLRSAGIPARWVKGFAPGELRRDEERKKYYTITNNQAHSWVEAYMPGHGWMPFEPTIGFNGVTNINFDIEMAEDDVKQQEELKRPELEKKKQEQQAAKRKKSNSGGLLELLPDWLKSGITWTVLLLVSTAAAIVLLLLTRKKWLPRLYVRRAQGNPGGWPEFASRYGQLLSQLERLGIRRPEGMTLNAYAVEVDKLRGDEMMSILTRVYEQGLYGQAASNADWAQLREMWEDLIIHTSG